MNRFLPDASGIFAVDADTGAALARVARTTVPAFADFCLIYLLQGHRLRCVAAAHRSRAGHRALQTLLRVYRITRDDPGSTVAQVVRLRRPSLRATIRPEENGQADDRPAAALRVVALHRQLGVRSALAVPLEGAQGVIGALALSYAESGRRYSTADIGRARRIARHIVLLVQHAPLLTQVAREGRMLTRMLDRRLAASPPALLRASRPRARS